MQPLAKRPPTSSPAPASIDPAQMLLKAIERHMVIADDSQAQRFRAELSRLAGTTDLRIRPHDVAGLLENYAKETNQLIGQQRLGTMQLVSELNAGVAALPEPPATQFQEIEEQLDAISDLDDLEEVRKKVRENLNLLRSGMLKQSQQFGCVVSEAIERWRASQQVGSKPASSAGALHAPDPLTGLPGRDYAQSELTRTLVQFPNCQIAFFVVRRLNVINAKFGFSRGDEVLLKVVQMLAQALPDFSNMFRWSPCAFLIITSPNMSPDTVRNQVQVVEYQRMTPTLEWEGKSAMVSVGIEWKVMSVGEFLEPDLLFQRLDSLASGG
ncbi:MAG TPA: GGDEF domain-containing protein [Bryobacteraceae bacterium]|nr:GGDEF domain-containing protein [Bryobacteraceae bacterium]